MHITDFEFIQAQSGNDLAKWKTLVKKQINKNILWNAKQRTILNKEFPTLKLFWELGGIDY